MKVNLAREKPLTRDSGKVLTEAQLASLTDGNTTSSGVSISAGEVLSVVCDLGARYDLSELRYYRTRASTDTIALEGRQTHNDSWTAFSASGSSYSSTTLSGSDKYRYIRLTHSVTAGSGIALELEVYTDDSQIGFGSAEQGRLDEYSIDSGTDSLTPQAVYLHNPDSVSRDYFVLIDPQDSDGVDYALSSGVSGPFSSIYTTGVVFPTTFPWSNGSFTNTTVVSNTVRKSAGTTVSGTYFTPVVDLNSVEGRRLFWKATLSGTNELDINTVVDSQPTVHVRMSNTAPSSPWTNGQLSTDSRWSVVSGTLPFVTLPNNAILDPAYKRYFQARVEFHATTSGQTPILESLGVENAFKVPVPAGSSAPVYARSISASNRKGNPAALVCWYFESRDVE